MQSRNWIFTLNNPEDGDLERILNLEQWRYIVIGREVGEQGTPHLQGYGVFRSNQRQNAVRSLLPRAHVEIRRGTHQQAKDYAIKDGDFEERGDEPRQGRRNDLQAVKTALESGEPLRYIAEHHFSNFVRYARGISAYKSMLSIPRDFKTEVRVYWGVPGTGKTRLSFEQASNPWFWGGDNWFDGYDEHEHAIMDDFRGSCMKPSMLLKIMDRYPMRVPVKGGFVNWRPRILWITSNVNPRDWYPNIDSQTVQAILRRIDVERSFTADDL